MWPLWGYLVGVNLVAVLLVRWDKRCARRNKRRVPEARLWAVAWLGGAIGMFCAMLRVRHKTRHRSFMWGLPAVILLQGGLIFTFFTFYY